MFRLSIFFLYQKKTEGLLIYCRISALAGVFRVQLYDDRVYCFVATKLARNITVVEFGSILAILLPFKEECLAACCFQAWTFLNKDIDPSAELIC